MREAARLVLPALRLDRWEEEEVRERALSSVALGVGGFVLFGGEVEAVAELCRDLRRRSSHPLWIAADLERGAGQQFAGAPELPPPAALAVHPRAEEAVREAGTATARAARALGLNWVLAPVLDLDIEPQNPIVSTRSFGSDPARVARLGRAWIDACQETGVAACAKHFPGHGRTRADSHRELPRVAVDREALEEDLRPFRAVASHVASMMTAHVAYPALGCDGPATLCRPAVTDLLRGDLGFRGLAVTDAMIMEGVRGGVDESSDPAAGADAAAAAVRAVEAGCDLVLYPPDPAATARALAAAAAGDARLADRVREAAERSAAMCRRFAFPAASAAGSRRADEGETGADGLRGAEDGEALELATACVRSEGGTVRLPEPGRPLLPLRLSTDLPRPGRPPGGEALAAELRALGWEVEAPVDLPRAGSPGGSGRSARLVLVTDTPQGWKGRAGLPPEAARAVRRLAASGATVVLFGHPRTLEALGVGGICAWDGSPLMERAAARWIHRASSRAREGR